MKPKCGYRWMTTTSDYAHWCALPEGHETDDEYGHKQHYCHCGAHVDSEPAVKS